MTYLRHDHGKHYTEITGHWLIISVYRMTGRTIGKLKMKTVYRGVKGGK